MTRGPFFAAFIGFCVAAGSAAAQPNSTSSSPTATVSASAAATENSTRPTPSRPRATVLTNGAGRTLIVLGRGEGKR